MIQHRSFVSLLLAWGLAAALLAAGCAAPPQPKPGERGALPPPPEAQEPLPAVQKLLARGRVQLELGAPREALQLLEQALEKAQRPRGKGLAFLGLCRAEMALGRYDRALSWLRRLPQKLLEGPLGLEADFLEARIWQAQDKPDQVRQLLEHMARRPILDLPPVPAEQAVGYLQRGLAQNQAALELTKLLLYCARQENRWGRRDLPPVIARVAAEVAVAPLEGMVRREPDTGLKAALLSGLAVAYLRENRLEAARQTADYVSGLPQGGEYRPTLQAVEGGAGQVAAVQARAVGAVLPLSGPLADQGHAALAALKLGLGAGKQGAPELFVVDCGSQAQKADQAVRTLVERDQVAALVGPWEPLTALAAARAAQELKTPIVCLTAEEKLAAVGDYVFRNYFTRLELVGAVMEQVQSTGARLVALLGPADQEGREFSRLFARWAEEDRAAKSKQTLQTARSWLMEVMAPVLYQPDLSDLDQRLREMLRIPAGEPYRPNSPGGPKAVIKFDALWLPGKLETVTRVMPRLIHYGVSPRSFLGTSRWHDAGFLRRHASLVDGALFADGFNPNAGDPLVASFVEAFRQATGAAPKSRAAHAYDTALLLKLAVAGGGGPQTRAQVQGRLLEAHKVSGVCGRLTMGPDRRVRKKLKVFKVSGGAAQQVAEAL
jgi:ABC-type branched-subunit amino acid transport system substrate-binding protein